MEYNSEIVLNNLKDILGKTSIMTFNLETVDFLVKYNNLPRDIQLELLNNILDNVNIYYSNENKKDNQTICLKEGHIYSDWYESVSFKNYNGSSFHNRIWCKECQRCGHVDFTFVKPKELKLVKNKNEK